MKKYWFTFKNYSITELPPGLAYGCGITAYNYEDAISIIRSKVFLGIQLPNKFDFIENVSLEDLDKNHVLPNIGIPTNRGVWFPIGYE